MSRRRLFCSRKRLEEGVFTVTGGEAHHGATVCRLRSGDGVYIFTERGDEFRCEVVSTGRGRLKARVVEKLENLVESPLDVTLIQALPKAAKLEEIIVRGTELGLNRLQPVRTKRSFAGTDKLERWRRLALEATKQCGRRIIPKIEPTVPLQDLDLKQFSDSLKILSCEHPCAGSLKSLLAGQSGKTSVVVASGPEGGFTEDEMRLMLNAGFTCVCLGPRILRAETASLALLAALQYQLGDWEPGDEDKPACLVED